MRNIIYSIAVLLLFIAGVSCKSDLITYQGQTGIYFEKSALPPKKNGAAQAADSTFISFSLAKNKDSISNLIIAVNGPMVDYDRAYKLNVNPATTAISGQHYDALPQTLVIKKNRLTDTIKLKVYRTADIQTKGVHLILDLATNDHFMTNMKDKVTNSITGEKMSFVSHRVAINDMLKKPLRWFDPYLGVFSRKKLELMVEILGVDPAYIDAAYGNPSIGVLNAYGKSMQRYLNDMKAEGKTIYEADGITEMIMGASVQ